MHRAVSINSISLYCSGRWKKAFSYCPPLLFLLFTSCIYEVEKERTQREEREWKILQRFLTVSAAPKSQLLFLASVGGRASPRTLRRAVLFGYFLLILFLLNRWRCSCRRERKEKIV